MAERRRSAHAIDDLNNGGTLSAKKPRDPLSSYLYRSVDTSQRRQVRNGDNKNGNTPKRRQQKRRQLWSKRRQCMSQNGDNWTIDSYWVLVTKLGRL